MSNKKTATEEVGDWAMMREKLRPLCYRLISIFSLADDYRPSKFCDSQETRECKQIIAEMKKLFEEKGVK